MPEPAATLILAQTGPEAIFQQVAPLALILAVFYFLLIRPQQQKAKEHDEFLKGLKRGELVVTASGLYGRIVELGEHDVTLELAPNVKVRHERSKIAGSAKAAGAASKAE
jgi:preprotein translocase subunit YajC